MFRLFSNIFLILFFCLAFSFAQEKEKGQISFIEKKVKHKEGTNEWDKAKIGNKLESGHKVKTLLNSRAELSLQGLSLIRLAPQTTVNIEKLYEKSDQADSNETELALEGGDIWANVSKIDSDSKFSINSKIAGTVIRGTVLRMNVQKDSSTELRVYKGEVAITNKPGKDDLPPPKSIGRFEVQGPTEVQGPREISMMEWVYLVREMQKIRINPDGKVSWAKDFSANDKDEQTEWVKWNKKRDGQLKKQNQPTPDKPAKK
jgi:hypothetical protein